MAMDGAKPRVKFGFSYHIHMHFKFGAILDNKNNLVFSEISTFHYLSFKYIKVLSSYLYIFTSLFNIRANKIPI